MFICFGIPDDLVHDVVITTLKYVVPAILFISPAAIQESRNCIAVGLSGGFLYTGDYSPVHHCFANITIFYGIISPTTEKSYRRHPMCIPTIRSVCTATQRG